MKRVFLAVLSFCFLNVGYSQFQKADVQEILNSIDMNSLEKVYITFNTSEAQSKHKMMDENLASYEALDPKTLEIEFKDNYLHLNGKNYDLYVPYDKIKYIHTTKSKSLQIKISK